VAYWRWEYHYEFWQRMLEAPSPEAPAPAPVRRAIPRDAKSLKGVDRMRSLFAQVQRAHYRTKHQRR
jgi:hypothetical protein